MRMSHLIDATTGVVVSLLLLSTTACALKPVTVGVVFDDVWELGKDSLTEPEQSIVKATALRTLRQAYQGSACLGHQVFLGFALDSKCEDCYDGRTSTTYEHFFGTKHWSNDALAVMRRVLPRS
jgi:hypothetical protein